MNNLQLRVRLIVLIGTFLLGLNGCASHSSSMHYVEAYDPNTGVTNLFRIKFVADTCFSKSKFSMGLYDRSTVNRIFSETDLKQEYLSGEINLYDASGKRLKNMTAEFDKSKTARAEARIADLKHLQAGLAREIGTYQAMLASKPEIKSDIAILLAQASTLHGEGRNAIGTNTLKLASSKLQQCLGMLASIQSFLKGDVIVRHFDADGQPHDVSNYSTVAFMSTDASKFTSAFDQVAASEQASRNLVKIIFGPKIIEQQLIADELHASKVEMTALCSQLSGLVEGGFLQSVTDQTTLKDSILQMAKLAAGKINKFSSAEEIRTFALSMEEK